MESLSYRFGRSYSHKSNHCLGTEYYLLVRWRQSGSTGSTSPHEVILDVANDGAVGIFDIRATATVASGLGHDGTMAN
jgi:hypothetical protein